MTVTVRVSISGRVQGVGFRYYTLREARRRGVHGWVRNRSDGTVEAMLQGSREAVDGLLAWARTGPPSARVSDVEVSEGEGEYTSFEQRATE